MNQEKMNRISEIANQYISAHTAVVWCEMLVTPAAKGNWKDLRENINSGRMKIEDILNLFASFILDATLKNPERDFARLNKVIVEQFETPDFRRYIMGRLGLV